MNKVFVVVDLYRYNNFCFGVGGGDVEDDVVKVGYGLVDGYGGCFVLGVLLVSYGGDGQGGFGGEIGRDKIIFIWRNVL